MPRTKKPKFKVGDVVQWNAPKDFIPVNATLEDRGVITKIEDWTVGNYFYYIEWFYREEEPTIFYPRLKLCDGMKNTELCDQCKYFFPCWTSRGK
jgi:hypothetical protein